jgi:alcohol dehydrogenase class IV
MSLDVPAFVHDFQPGAIHYGRGCVADLGEAMAERGLGSALVVTGTNVGANREAMDPIEAGLGDRLAEVFDETSPAKRIETAYDGVERMHDVDADAIVAVGSGSSLDVARFVRVLDGEFRELEEIRTEVEETGTVAVPDDPDTLTPLFVVPTTFAGADMSVAAAITYPTADGGRAETIPVAKSLMPTGLFYDPALFETTPTNTLAGSAINGFDKALETVYSAFANPITDATAVRSLGYLRDSLPELRDAENPAVMDRAVMGIVLAQYGVSMPEAYKINVVHAFGHALRNEFGLQQGVAHAIVVPRVLELIFEQVDGRRSTLAEGLVVDENVEDEAAAVVAAVEAIRDGLELPSRLRDVEGPTEEGLHDAAVYARNDPFMDLGPEGFDPSVEDLEGVLRDAW